MSAPQKLKILFLCTGNACRSQMSEGWARSFQDPPALARAAQSEEEALAHYRRVRDEIRAFVETLAEALTRKGPAT